MAKQVGYEVTAQRPVCVDFRDGRVVSYRPGSRFEAEVSNVSVQRLLRNKDVRVLSAMESVPVTAVKLGAPPREQAVVKVRNEVERARQDAIARLAASQNAPPVIEVAKPAPAPMKKKPKKPESLTDVSGPAADL
jgi:hypothetical protein